MVPLVPANQIYQELATVRRMANPFQPCVISICSFHTGVSYNVIPHSVEIAARCALSTRRPARA